MTIFVEANAQKHVFFPKNDTFQKLTKIPINHEISLKNTNFSNWNVINNTKMIVQFHKIAT